MDYSHPMSAKMRAVLATVADAKAGEISGWSIAKWLNSSTHPEGIRESLRALTNRGLIVMRPMDDPPQQFPNRLKAMYSIFAEPEEDNEGEHFIGTHEMRDEKGGKA